MGGKAATKLAWFTPVEVTMSLSFILRAASTFAEEDLMVPDALEPPDLDTIGLTALVLLEDGCEEAVGDVEREDPFTGRDPPRYLYLLRRLASSKPGGMTPERFQFS